MHIIIQLGLILAAWRWSDWKHWNKYYPSILFLIIGDLYYNFVTYNYALWKFTPATFDKFLYFNHTTITLSIDFFGFPALVLLYLSKYPAKRLHQVFYVLAWTLLNTVFELISFYFTKGIAYDHGWNLMWSTAVNLLLYVVLRIHYLRPLIAWIIFYLCAIFFMIYFRIPFKLLK